MLVLVLAEFILQDFIGGVGLIAADAEGQPDITKLGGDIGVDGALFGVIGGETFGEFLFFLLDCRRDRDA